MTRDRKAEQSHEAAWRAILEMIDASWELAERLGKHSLRKGCNCIACVNKRKRLIFKQETEWKYRL